VGVSVFWVANALISARKWTALDATCKAGRSWLFDVTMLPQTCTCYRDSPSVMMLRELSPWQLGSNDNVPSEYCAE